MVKSRQAVNKMLAYRYNNNKTSPKLSLETSNTLNPEILKTLIKESVREIMREEWYNFFEMLLLDVDDAEQADIEATFNPPDYREFTMSHLAAQK